MRKAIAAVAAAAMLVCTLGLAACSGGETSGSSEEEVDVGDGVSGVVETDGVYYTDLFDEEGYAESLVVTLDTVIVPVEASGDAIDDCFVVLSRYSEDETERASWEWTEVEAEYSGEDGFTLRELLSDGAVYYDRASVEELEDGEYEGAQEVDVDVELSADGVYSLAINWGDIGVGFTVELTEDDLEYSSVEVNVAW